ncbi:carboxypeptidase-like regulatory domain-containing protein [Sphingomicrobium nitratireducens]|uniref:carboxypeptidase-like regulatory domain-containing protein n=1 Tax=Sphingomicrobium nitratireducens TaxID=2964666 RepID=UPI00224087EF|nr:carboxypeptidase-like regulatory domain-containing protein [Sphingomicrobium nitratireducens]
MRLRSIFRNALTLLALVAGGVSAPAESPVTERWVADPEEQYLLDVRLRMNRIGDGVRAYPTPEGACIVFGDFLSTLDVPLKIDIEEQRAHGWAFSEENTIDIDRAAGEVITARNREAIAKSDIREVPEGWCVASDALARWFDLGLEANMSGALLRVESEAKLPVELAIERRKRAEALLERATFDMAALPQVKLPYRMWRTPALDVIVSGGAAYSAHSGVKIDRSAAVYASGEIAKMSFDARLANEQLNGTSLRLRAYRSDPGADLLGFLHATHLEIGDLVHGANGVGSIAGGGRGALVTNRPLRRLANFDRVTFEGELPAGWDAELYRNGQLLAFATASPDGKYLFEDIELTYGDNEVEIVLYGPQGQIRRRLESVTVGEQQIPPGQTWYFASVSQPGRQLVELGGGNKPQYDLQATVALDHGLDRKTSVGLLAQTLLEDDQRVSYVEGAVRRTLGRAFVEVSASANEKGGFQLRSRAIAQLGKVALSLSSRLNRGLTIDSRENPVRAEYVAGASVPIKLGKRTVPVTARLRLTDNADGSKALEAATRFNVALGRFNLGTEFDWTRSGIGHAYRTPSDAIGARLIGSGRVGKVRLQGVTDFDLDKGRLRTAELSAYWSAGERVDWDAGIGWQPDAGRLRARVSHIRKLDIASLALTAEAATDGSVAAGINLAFSIDAPNGRWRPTSRTLARNGSIKARLFRDDNGNGIRDADEPYQAGAGITAGMRASDAVTDDRGEVVMAGLATHTPVAVGVDLATIDPSLAPAEALRVVVPRPGVTASVDIPLVGAGMVEGVLVNAGGGGTEGVEIVLLDRTGRKVASARSEFDGYFLIEKVPYGNYRLAIAKASAAFLQVKASLDTPVLVTPDAPYQRVGTIALKPETGRIAESAPTPTLPDGIDPPQPPPVATASLAPALGGGE